MPELDLSILSNLRPATSKNTNRKSLVGQKYHRLTVYAFAGYAQTSQGMSYWLCRCDCGNWRVTAKGKLISGLTKSCGCYRAISNTKTFTTHGLKNTKVYGRWTDMHTRCYNPKFKQYADWGGRGICVCEGFKKFENFFDAIGHPPPSHQLDRINNEGNYSCGACEECLSKNWPMNCRWAPRKMSARNKRTTRWITIHGQTKSMAEWVEISGVNQPTAWRQLAKGIAPEIVFDIKE